MIHKIEHGEEGLGSRHAKLMVSLGALVLTAASCRTSMSNEVVFRRQYLAERQAVISSVSSFAESYGLKPDLGRTRSSPDVWALSAVLTTSVATTRYEFVVEKCADTPECTLLMIRAEAQEADGTWGAAMNVGNARVQASETVDAFRRITSGSFPSPFVEGSPE